MSGVSGVAEGPGPLLSRVCQKRVLLRAGFVVLVFNSFLIWTYSRGLLATTGNDRTVRRNGSHTRPPLHPAAVGTDPGAVAVPASDYVWGRHAATLRVQDFTMALITVGNRAAVGPDDALPPTTDKAGGAQHNNRSSAAPKADARAGRDGKAAVGPADGRETVSQRQSATSVAGNNRPLIDIPAEPSNGTAINESKAATGQLTTVGSPAIGGLLNNITSVTGGPVNASNRGIDRAANGMKALADRVYQGLPTEPRQGNSSGSRLAMPACMPKDRQLLGHVNITEKYLTSDMFDKIEATVSKGGHFRPSQCVSLTKVAIIIPFRHRENQVPAAMNHLHPFLQRQLIEYQIFIVEQSDGELFNRAMLFNIGYVTARKVRPFDCYIFSDLDLLPMDDRLIYDCSNSPKHMSTYVDKLDEAYMGVGVYFLKQIYGGVMALSDQHFRAINGFSNVYFGWGGEDDDLGHRLGMVKLKVYRFVKEKYMGKGVNVTQPWDITEFGHYHALDHETHTKKETNVKRFQLLRFAKRRMHYDGLNCLKYTLLRMEARPLFTLVRVRISRGEVEPLVKRFTCKGRPLPD